MGNMGNKSDIGDTYEMGDISEKMTVRGTMVRSEVCNSWCFCLEP